MGSAGETGGLTSLSEVVVGDGMRDTSEEGILEMVADGKVEGGNELLSGSIKEPGRLSSTILASSCRSIVSISSDSGESLGETSSMVGLSIASVLLLASSACRLSCQLLGRRPWRRDEEPPSRWAPLER